MAIKPKAPTCRRCRTAHATTQSKIGCCMGCEARYHKAVATLAEYGYIATKAGPMPRKVVTNG